MTKKVKITVGVCVGVIAAVLIAGGAYLQHLGKSSTFFRNTTINGADVSGLTPEKVAENLLKDYDGAEVSLTENGQEVLKGTLEQYGYTFDESELTSELTDLLNQQKKDFSSRFHSLFGGNQSNVKVTYHLNEDTLASFVKEDSLSGERTASQNASIQYDAEKKTCYVSDAVEGNEVDDEKLQEAVKEDLNSALDAGKDMQNYQIEIPKSAYIAPEVTQDDAALQKEAEILNQYVNDQVTYTFGSETEVLDFSTIIGWLSVENGEIQFDEDQMKEYVQTLESKYNTRYKERTFKTTGGETITIPANKNDYGYTIDEDGEIAQLKTDILSKQAVSREPVYKSKNSYGNPLYLKRNGTDDLAGTYVEVSISQQHVWFYKDGKLVVEGDCVTGDTTKGRGTDTGVYPIAYKATNYTLTSTQNGYASFVNYWMPFYEGEGLHDATWRSSFGGSIYRGNGSHGCVNLPLSLAKTIYENIDAGTAVVLYN